MILESQPLRIYILKFLSADVIFEHRILQNFAFDIITLDLLSHSTFLRLAGLPSPLFNSHAKAAFLEILFSYLVVFAIICYFFPPPVDTPAQPTMEQPIMVDGSTQTNLEGLPLCYQCRPTARPGVENNATEVHSRPVKAAYRVTVEEERELDRKFEEWNSHQRKIDRELPLLELSDLELFGRKYNEHTIPGMFAILSAAGVITGSFRASYMGFDPTAEPFSFLHRCNVEFRFDMWNALKLLADEVDEQEAKDLIKFACATSFYDKEELQRILFIYGLRSICGTGVRAHFSFEEFSKKSKPGNWALTVFGKTFVEFWPSLLFIYHSQLFAQSPHPLDTTKKICG